jgi:hypothetical protein
MTSVSIREAATVICLRRNKNVSQDAVRILVSDFPLADFIKARLFRGKKAFWVGSVRGFVLYSAWPS